MEWHLEIIRSQLMDSSSETTPFFKDILIELRNIGGGDGNWQITAEEQLARKSEE